MGFRPLTQDIEADDAVEPVVTDQVRGRGFRPIAEAVEPATAAAAPAPVQSPAGPGILETIKSMLPSPLEAAAKLPGVGSLPPVLAPIGMVGEVAKRAVAERQRRGVMDGYVAPEPSQELDLRSAFPDTDFSGNMTRPRRVAPPGQTRVEPLSPDVVLPGRASILDETKVQTEGLLRQMAAGNTLAWQDAYGNDASAREAALRRASGGADMISASQRRLNDGPVTRDVGNNLETRLANAVRDLTPDKGSVVSALSQSAIQIPALAGGLALGSRVAALTPMVYQVYGPEYAAGIREGLSPAIAADLATKKAAVNVVTEMPVVGMILKAPIGNLLSGTAAQKLAAVKYLAGVSGAEMGSEMVATMGEVMADAAAADPNATLEQLGEQLRDTFKQMLVQGPLLAGAGRTMRAVPAVARRAEEALDPQRSIARAFEEAIEAGPLVPGTVDALRGGEQGRVREQDSIEEAAVRAARSAVDPDRPLAVNAVMATRVDLEPDRTGGDSPIDAYVDPMEAQARLSRTLARDESVAKPKNARTVLRDADGNEMVVGSVTADDWIKRVERNVPKAEFPEARYWYRNLHDTLTPIYGEQAPRVALAWLLSQQRASPSKGMQDVLRAMDHVRGLPVEKRAGLNAEALKAVLRGQLPKEGVGAKLMDFLDAELGLPTRTVMGRDPRGGQPAPFDVWGMRDSGVVDDAMRNKLLTRFPAAARLQIDPLNATNEAFYERGSRFYNNLAKHLNSIGYDGGNWTAREAQAVGWVAIQKALGETPEYVSDIIGKNTRRVSLGLAPGAGSAIAPDAPLLQPENAARVSDELAELAGIKVLKRAAGTGAYLTEVEGAIQIDALASPEAVRDYMNMLGYVFQQSEVIATRPLKSGKQGSVDIVFEDSAAGRENEFFQTFHAAVSDDGIDLAPGFQQINIDGRAGIRLLNLSGHWKQTEIEQIRTAAALAANMTDISLSDVVDSNIDLESVKNDWTKQKAGEAYLGAIRDRRGLRQAQQLERIARRAQGQPAGRSPATGEGGRNSRSGQGAQSGPQGLVANAVRVAASEIPLTAEQRAVERRAREYVENNLDEAVDRYIEMFGTEINTDNARELFPDYAASPAARAKHAASVHEAASVIAKAVYEKLLREPAPDGKWEEVLFTAGGTGVGKTSALRAPGFTARQHITYDNNLNNPQSGARKIEQALAAGKSVVILLTYRNPLDSFINGVLPRAMKPDYGRTVPVAVHAAVHAEMPGSIRELMERFRDDDRVHFIGADNSKGRGNVTLAHVSDLLKRQYNVTVKELEDAVQKALTAGRISPSVAKATLGAKEEAGEGGGAEAARAPDGEGNDLRVEQVVAQGGLVYSSARDGGGHTWESLRLSTPRSMLELQRLGFSTRDELNGVYGLNKTKQEVLAKAIGDLVDDGMPASLFAGIKSYVVIGGEFGKRLGEAVYWPQINVMGVNAQFLERVLIAPDGDAAGRLRSYLAHEVGHAVDRKEGVNPSSTIDFYASENSDRLGIDVDDYGRGFSLRAHGDLATEVLEAMRLNAELQDFFNYPIGHLVSGNMGERLARVELFAQVSALYAVNPGTVRDFLPTWYPVMEQIYGTKPGQQPTFRTAIAPPRSLSEARARVSNALQDDRPGRRIQDGDAQRWAARSGGPNQPGAARGPPGQRVASAVRSAPPAGGQSGQPPGAAVVGLRNAPGAGQWGVDQPGLIDNLLREWQNNQIDLKATQEAIERAGGVITERGNAYLAEELYRDRVTSRVKRFFNASAKPLLTAIRDSGLTIEEAGRFLWARHAPERNRQMAKINPGGPKNLSGLYDSAQAAAMAGQPGAPNAQDIIAQLRAKAKPGALADIAAKVDAITSATRAVLVNEGLEEAGTIAAWQQAYQHYVPLMRDIEGSGTGQGFVVTGPESKRAMGSQREAQAIIAALISQHEHAIIRAEKARVGRALLRLAAQHPNPSFWKIDDPPKKRTINKSTGLVEIGIDPQYKQRADVFVVKTKGPNGEVVERVITFNENNERAMKLAAAMRNLDVVQLDGVTKAVGKVTRIMASLATSWNPLFWTTNFARDVQTAVVNLQSTPLRGRAPRVIANIPRAMAGIASAEFRNGQGKWAKLYREFEEQGGKMEWINLFNDLVEREKQLASEIKSSQRGKLNPLKWGEDALDIIEKTNSLIENVTRLSTFAEAREMGLSPAQAASLAKSLTVNFRRKGNRSTATGAWYMFFNASVQGTARMISGIAKSPRAQAMVGGMVAFSAALELINRLMGDRDRDEDENSPYELIPEYVKQRNMIFMLPGGSHVAIPLPYGFNVFHIAGRVMMETVLGAAGSDLVDEKRKPAELAWSFAESVIDSFLPLGTASSPGQLIAPTVLDPFVQHAENKTWYGSPMRPEPFPGQGEKPDHQLYFRSTSDTAKDITKWLNDMTGGDDIRGGAIDISPTTLTHIFGTITGGTGRFGLGVFDFTKHVVNRATGEAESDDLPWRAVPFVGKFYGEVEDRDRAAKFYRLRPQAETLLKQVRDYKKLGDADKAESLIEKEPALYAMGQEMSSQSFKKALKATRDEIKAVDALPREERAKVRRELAAEEATILGQALRAYNESVRENRARTE